MVVVVERMKMGIYRERGMTGVVDHGEDDREAVERVSLKRVC